MNMYIKLLLLFYITIISVTSQHHPNQTIPLSSIKQLNDVEESSKFKDKLDESSNRKSISLKPQPAECTPTLQHVKLQSSKSDDPNYLVFPPSARIEQCGGYCSSSLQSCQPVEIETVTLEVLIEKIPVGQFDTARYIESVPVEKHTKCRCGCKVKPEDCHALQTYSEDDCQCECTNNEERVFCKWNELKKWDAETCECRCLANGYCTTGSTFDQNTCTCV